MSPEKPNILYIILHLLTRIRFELSFITQFFFNITLYFMVILKMAFIFFVSARVLVLLHAFIISQKHIIFCDFDFVKNVTESNRQFENLHSLTRAPSIWVCAPVWPGCSSPTWTISPWKHIGASWHPFEEWLFVSGINLSWSLARHCA